MMPADLRNPRLGAHLIDEKLSGLDVRNYSAFKHGKSGIASEYASDIFDKVLSDKLSREIPYAVVLSPSTYLPTASHSIGIALHQLMENKGYRTRLAKIRRNCTYTADYGMMSDEERLALITNDDFSLEERFTPKEQLLFVDDVSISGAHQHVVEKMLLKHRVENKLHFLYYAVAADTKVDSRIEGVMNNALVRGVQDLLQLMADPDFVINTRVVKLILNSDELGEKWLDKVPSEILRNLIVGARGNNYHEIAEYAKNLQIVERSWKAREFASSG